MDNYVIGLDYGSDSARAVVVDARTGATLATSVKYYPRWREGRYCDPATNQWRQHPLDYLEVLEGTVREALSQCPAGVADKVAGIGIDTTGSTPCFVDEQGRPLALLPEFAENPNAMFVLWKDHTAVREAEQINAACHRPGAVDYTRFIGGIYSAEWFWAKALHVLRADAGVAAKAYSIVEHCDWLPAVLCGVTRAADIVRSRCAAGHKAMWHPSWGGLPPEEFLAGLDPLLRGFRSRLFETTATSDQPVGHLCREWAERLGLPESVRVAVGAFDCHMGAVGAAVEPRTLVRVIGTSTCDVMVSPYAEIGDRQIRGICGQVDGSVVPGQVGLEAGQSSFGDVFAMFRRVLEFPLRSILPGLLAGKMPAAEVDKLVGEAADRIIVELTRAAEQIPFEQTHLVATDWINGRRTPDANQLLTGSLHGLTLGTSAPLIFRALVEATAFGTRAIVERFVREGVAIDGLIGIGGIALKSPYVMQTMCDVVGLPIKVCHTDQACALGASMFGATAAGLYQRVEDAIAAMNSGFASTYHPNADRKDAYDKLYAQYLELGAFAEKSVEQH